MRVRTVLVTALAIGTVWALAILVMANQTILKQELRLWGETSIRVDVALVVSFVGGLLLALIVGFSREAGRMLERWRLRKESRRSEEIEEEYSKGLVAGLEGHEEEARRHFRAVLERDSRHFNTLIKLGDVLRAQGRVDEAIELHGKARHQKEDDTRPLYALVEDYEAKGDLDQARNVLGKIIGINKNSVAAWRKLRSLHLKEDGWDKALEAHEKLVKLAPTSGPHSASDSATGLGIRYEIAMQRLHSGKHREAVTGLRRLIKEDISFIPAHHGLGRTLLLQGRELEAVNAWYAGFEATGSAIFLSLLEEHYLQQEQPLAAIEALKRAITRVKKDTLPRFYLGKLYFRLEMLDDAFSVLSALEGRTTYAPSLHFLLGRIHERRQQFGEAAVEYRQVVKELDLMQLEYACRSCAAPSSDWSDRCKACGAWSTIEVNLRDEISLDELGLAPAPIYTAPA